MQTNNNNISQESLHHKSVHSRYIMLREDIYHVLSPLTLMVYLAIRFQGDFAQDSAPVKRNIKSLCNKAKVGRTLCFEAIKELEHHGLIKRIPDSGYQNMYLIAQELNYFTPTEIIKDNPPPSKIDLPPVRQTDDPVRQTDDITINISNNKTLKPSVDFESTKRKKEYKEDVLFMEFYSNYPVKEKPSLAHKALYKHDPTPEFVAMIVADVKARIANNWLGREKNKIPFPATYLNAREWEGDIIPTKKQKKSKTLEEMHPEMDLSQVEFL